MIEVTLNKLEHLTVDTLVSFFDGESQIIRQKLDYFVPYFEVIKVDYSEIFSEGEPLQVDGNLLNLTIDFIGTADRVISIEKREDIITFIRFYVEREKPDYMVPYNDILLTCGGEDEC